MMKLKEVQLGKLFEWGILQSRGPVSDLKTVTKTACWFLNIKEKMWKGDVKMLYHKTMQMEKQNIR